MVVQEYVGYVVECTKELYFQRALPFFLPTLCLPFIKLYLQSVYNNPLKEPSFYWNLAD